MLTMDHITQVGLPGERYTAPTGQLTWQGFEPEPLRQKEPNPDALAHHTTHAPRERERERLQPNLNTWII